jgi:predicted AlkP superfamily pyrophosphatase or phosphodiesterase
MTARFRVGLVLTTMAVGACQSSPQPAAPQDGTPSLVVLLAVDQLSAELLARYEDVFDGGLRRVLDEGLSFENATLDYSGTVTAPGHTTLGTGVYPARHGIVSNEWVERDGAELRQVYSVSDPDAEILGYPGLEGMGPRNIERAGLASWIQANDPRSRVVSIGKKERSAIGLAAQAIGDVYWLPEAGGSWATSSAYMDEYPDWVQRFNREQMPRLYADTIWETIVPESLAPLSRPDTSRWEFDREHTFFPHHARDHVDDMADPLDLNEWRWDYTPYPDRAMVSFVIEAVRALELGQRGSVDFLGVGLSQTDRIGHTFGPGSREQLDNLLRLDDELDRLFDAFDEEVGEGRWVLALSADHGVVEIPEHLADAGVAGAGRISRAQRDSLVDRIASATPGGEWAIREAVSALPFVAGAYTFEEIERGPPADSFAVLIAHSHSRTRLTSLSTRAGVYVRYPENWLAFGSGVTTHGSVYYYDRHVPLVFLGAGVAAGTSSERVATVDVAPTLARLAGVPIPDDLDGRVIPEVGGR